MFLTGEIRSAVQAQDAKALIAAISAMVGRRGWLDGLFNEDGSPTAQAVLMWAYIEGSFDNMAWTSFDEVWDDLLELPHYSEHYARAAHQQSYQGNEQRVPTTYPWLDHDFHRDSDWGENRCHVSVMSHLIRAKSRAQALIYATALLSDIPSSVDMEYMDKDDWRSEINVIILSKGAQKNWRARINDLEK